MSLFIGEGMLFTPVSLFVIVLMIYPASSSLTHAPISNDPSIHSVVEYTREAEIKSAYQRWYVLYTRIVVCGFIWYHPLFPMLQSLRTQAYAVLFIIPEKPKLSLFI